MYLLIHAILYKSKLVFVYKEIILSSFFVFLRNNVLSFNENMCVVLFINAILFLLCIFFK